MPLAYPNLHAPFISFTISPTYPTSSSTTSFTDPSQTQTADYTALPASITTILNDRTVHALKISDFRVEKSVIEESECEKIAAGTKSGSSSRSSSVSYTGSIGGLSFKDGGSANYEEEKSKRETESKPTPAEPRGASANSNGGPSEAKQTDGIRTAMLQRMKSLTMADNVVCERYLTKANYNLEGAVMDFYSNEG